MPRKRPSASGRRRTKPVPPKPITQRYAEKLAEQRQQRRESLQRKRAKYARDHYRPRKSDRGKFVMVGVKGKRDPQAKGRKGYLVYVTKTGKKWLVKTSKEERYKARKLSDLEPAFNPRLAKATKQFVESRRVKVGESTVAVKKRGKLSTGGPWDFNDKTVAKFAKGIKDGIEQQASHRSFIITAIVFVELPDGTERSVEVLVPIDKPDHVAIKLAGIKNFVMQKFYAFMARELAYLGYVTSGSANHIRRLGENRGAKPGEYVDRRGEHWAGNGMEIVRILRIDWRLEQAR